jgi:hypothetical protein
LGGWELAFALHSYWVVAMSASDGKPTTLMKNEGFVSGKDGWSASDLRSDGTIPAADFEETLVDSLQKQNAALLESLRECEAALEKVCKRNDIGEAVMDYYGDCAMARDHAREALNKIKARHGGSNE